MRRRIATGWMVVLALSAWSVGCDGDPPQDAEDAAMEDTLRQREDTTPDDDSGDVVEDTAPVAPDSTDGGGTEEDISGCDGRVCDNCVACKFKNSTERSCSDNQPPQRCDADPTTYGDWGASSVLTHLEVSSDAAKDCCFNIDGSKDGSPDNQLGEVAGALPFDVDRELKERLTNGGFATLMEHQGLKSLSGSQTFDGNIYVGYFANADSSNFLQNTESECNLARQDCSVESSAGESFLVSPESFDDGTHPQVQFHPTELNDGALTGGPSRVVLNFGVRGVGSLILDIRGTMIEGDVVASASDLEGNGVTIENGRLGGYVLLKDVVTLLNNLLTPCDCLGNPEAAIQYPGTSSGDPDLFPDNCSGQECQLTCTEMVEQRASECGAGSGVICEETERICSTVGGLVQLADLDSDSDGRVDALSIGAMFEMTGAKIEGVADYVSLPDQPLGNGSVAANDAFANEAGWLAVYDDRSLSPDAVVGHTRVEAGRHNRVSVEVSGVSETTTLRAVLHRDDGPQTGTFEAGEDTKVKRYPEMSGYVSDDAEIRAP
ncbi:MAG: hypothetical protein ABEN55_00855 [Bradymonadaceae bacterium]